MTIESTKPSSNNIGEVDQYFERTENKPIELIFILFSAYKHELSELCKKYNCEFTLEMKVYKVSGKGVNE